MINDASGNSLTYDPLYLDVYLNGFHLDPTDYTATNGTSIVLTNGAAADDVLTVDKGDYSFTASTAAAQATVDDATALAIALG